MLCNRQRHCPAETHSFSSTYMAGPGLVQARLDQSARHKVCIKRYLCLISAAKVVVVPAATASMSLHAWMICAAHD